MKPSSDVAPATAPRNVLYLHTTSEVGGSDVSLVRLVERLDRARFLGVHALRLPDEPHAVHLGHAQVGHQEVEAAAPEPLERGLAVGHVAYGESYLVFNVKDLAQRFERVRAVPGVVVETAPDFGAAAPPPGQMHVIGSNIWDPDGYFVELNLMLQAPAG